jgi:hypothetical protein
MSILIGGLGTAFENEINFKKRIHNLVFFQILLLAFGSWDQNSGIDPLV